MKAFRNYVQTLEKLYLDVTSPRANVDLFRHVATALDGQAGQELRRLVPVSKLRATGAFFTGSELAAKAALCLQPSIEGKSTILDPACGAGDLLVACAKNLPPRRGFRATLAAWGRRLFGRDLQPEFVAAARYRLTLAALARGLWPRYGGETTDSELFCQVTAGCGLTDREAYDQATHVIINPPFNLIPAPPECNWANGKVSSAAVFLDACLRQCKTGTHVVAILPDVLRSGTRYRLWREEVTSRAHVESVDLFGRFDRWADVDVFLLHLTASREPAPNADQWQYPTTCANVTVGDLFDVSVGPVVPFRHLGGPWQRYLHAQGLPAWETIEEVRENRRFRGPLHSPPFVVVRRTSRLGDRHRAVGTVIGGSTPIAVENHLLVLRPKDGGLAPCRRLLGVLRAPETSEWLNRRIRCRHLTVDAIRHLPLGGWEQ